jgi:hypothetical protein
MGGGPVFRSLAALGTLGLSEAAQKKPFQDLGNDNPVNASAGGPLRFIPGGAQIAAVTGTADDAQKKLDAAAETERQRAARGRMSTILIQPR